MIDGFGEFLGGNNIGVTTSNGLASTSLIWDFDSPLSDPFHANTNTMQTVLGIPSSDNPLTLEYSLAPGDSGGGNFIFEGGTWWLAGVSSGIADLYTYPNNPPSNNATYGDLNLVTRVSSYQSFIDSFVPTASVPEPSMIAALCLICGIAFRYRCTQGVRAVAGPALETAAERPVGDHHESA